MIEECSFYFGIFLASFAITLLLSLVIRRIIFNTRTSGIKNGISVLMVTILLTFMNSLEGSENIIVNYSVDYNYLISGLVVFAVFQYLEYRKENKKS